MEEERFIAEANNAAKLSAEIEQFQRETRLQQKTAAERSISSSIVIDPQRHHKGGPKRTEPLITKAYNAFR